MDTLRRILSHKPLHFLLGGLLVYVLRDAAAPVPAPEPVALDDAARAQLRASWAAATGREPSAEEAVALERQELDDEVLFREALSLGLDRRDEVVRQRLLLNMRFLGGTADTDEDALLEQAYAMDMQRNDLVVRRRLVQVMEFALSEGADSEPATEAELAAMYAERREEFAEPPRWQLVHVYFSGDRRGERAADDAREALARLQRDGILPAQAVAQGDPFLGGHALPLLGAPQLASQFGNDFVAGLAACAPQAWCGPVRSAFGEHLVWVESALAARIPAADEPDVRRRLEADVRRARAERQLADALVALRRKYGVNS